MDIEELKAFLMVAKTQSFSGAANQLHLTQPAVSKRIASLEESLRSPLFDRVGRKITLTAAGHTLLPRAENILRELDEARQAMADLSGSVRGDLRVATSHHLGLHKLPPILRAYAGQYPEVNLQFEFLDSEVALHKVARGECELGVMTLSPEPTPHVLCDLLWNDPLVFVTQKENPMPCNVDLQTLSHLPSILPDLSTYTGRLVKACFEKNGLPLNLNMSTNFLETIKMLVSVGLGWSVLPQSMIDNQLKVLSVPGIHLSRSLGVVRHEKRHLSNSAQAFYDMLHAKKAEL